MHIFQRASRPPADAVERALQFHVALLTLVAGLLVDLNREGQAVTPILFVAASLGFLFSDLLRWFSIPRVLVGIITLGAIAPLWMGFRESDTHRQLVLITYLLTIWLSVIFFQQKSPRVYGGLIVLSLLLVVISAVLSSGIVFAVLLVVYELLGLSALVLLYIHSSQRSLLLEYQAGINQIPDSSPAVRNSYGVLLGGPPIAFQDPGSLPYRGHMWHRATISHTIAMWLATLVFGSGFFYAVPRVTKGEWNTQRRSSQAIVGFTSEMTFNEMGRILQSDELAFRISYTDAKTGKEYTLVQEPYVQGVALTHYEIDAEGKSMWRQFDKESKRRLVEIAPDYTGEIVRQEVLLQPTTETTLFAIPAAFQGGDTPDELRIDRQGGRLQAGEQSAGRQLRYVVYTTGCRNNAQTPLVPVIRLEPRSRIPFHTFSESEKRRLLSFRRERFPELTRLAEEVASQSPDRTNVISVARLLQDHFHSEDRYTYTLDFNAVAHRRNNQLDPIEDFVANHRTGHCEYFASALALMLRSVGIPSRVVVGYYGGEYNRLGGYYQVYQRNAHAWVEIYLEPDQVPRGPLSQAIPIGGAAWYRLDPTPPQNVEIAARSGYTLGQLLDYLQLMWNDYVMDMNSRAGQTPVLASEGGPNANDSVPVLDRIRVLLRGWWAGPQTFLEAWRREGWWNWRGGVVAAVITAVAYCLQNLLRLLRRGWALRRRRESRRSRRATRTIEFYRRLENLLAQIGCQRRASQTQREFAMDARQELLDHTEPRAAQVPERIVEYFYRVRFGQRELEPKEIEEIESYLQTVNQAVASLQANGSGNGRARA